MCVLGMHHGSDQPFNGAFVVSVWWMRGFFANKFSVSDPRHMVNVIAHLEDWLISRLRNEVSVTEL